MKKFISLILILLLVGCSNTKKHDENEILTSPDGFPEIHKNVLKSYIEPIELNIANYKDIFDLVKHECNYVDGYGNVVEVYSDLAYLPKEGYYYDSDNLNIILHDNKNNCDYTLFDLEYIKTMDDGTYLIHDVDEKTCNKIDKVFDLDNCECKQISGEVYKVTIPDEFIHKDIHSTGAEQYCVDYFWYEGESDDLWHTSLLLDNLIIKDFVEENY